MRRKFVASAVVVCVVLLIPVTWGWRRSIQPVDLLSISPTLIDDGEVGPSLQKREYEFRIYNPTNRIVEVTSVRPGCSCTVANIPSEIAPQSWVIGSVSVSPRLGKENYRVSVEVSQGNNTETAILEIRLTFRNAVTHKDTDLFLGDLVEGKPFAIDKQFALEPAPASEFELVSSVDWMQAQMVDENTIRISGVTPQKRGVIRAGVQIVEGERSIYLRVSIHSVAEIRSMPRRIFCSVRPGHRLAQIRLVGAGSSNVAVESNVVGGSLTVEKVEGASGPLYRVLPSFEFGSEQIKGKLNWRVSLGKKRIYECSTDVLFLKNRMLDHPAPQ